MVALQSCYSGLDGTGFAEQPGKIRQATIRMLTHSGAEWRVVFVTHGPLDGATALVIAAGKRTAMKMEHLGKENGFFAGFRAEEIKKNTFFEKRTGTNLKTKRRSC